MKYIYIYSVKIIHGQTELPQGMGLCKTNTTFDKEKVYL